MRKCTNKISGYCKGEPDYEEQPKEYMQRIGTRDVPPGIFLGGKCRRNPKTCGLFLTSTQAGAMIPPGV